ncbi:MAG: enoyl-CoA hydratase [Acidobacteria bacterium]|nr:enoyl-CoA hydratase [Acidobacteriota bacterium]
MTELVTIDTNDAVAHVRLNRADKYNALSLEMIAAIIEVGESLLGAKDVRAVVLSGNGKGFCAGLDFESFQALVGVEASGGIDQLLARDHRPENYIQRCAYIWKQLPMPVVVAVHGVAYGGGLQIMLGADIRIGAPDTRLSVMEIKWGLVPDIAITQTLRDLVRLDVAKELVYSGRVVNAQEAVQLGLLTRIADDPLAKASALAAEIAAKSPHAIRAGKKLLNEGWHAEPATGLRLESTLQATLLTSENQVEAVTANFEKREPRFKDP